MPVLVVVEAEPGLVVAVGLVVGEPGAVVDVLDVELDPGAGGGGPVLTIVVLVVLGASPALVGGDGEVVAVEVVAGLVVEVDVVSPDVDVVSPDVVVVEAGMVVCVVGGREETEVLAGPPEGLMGGELSAEADGAQVNQAPQINRGTPAVMPAHAAAKGRPRLRLAGGIGTCKSWEFLHILVS